MENNQRYRINAMLDTIKEMHRLKNDSGLSRKLDVWPPVISKIRSQRIPVSATMIIRIHEVTEWPIARIKAMIAKDMSPADGSDKK